MPFYEGRSSLSFAYSFTTQITQFSDIKKWLQYIQLQYPTFDVGKTLTKTFHFPLLSAEIWGLSQIPSSTTSTSSTNVTSSSLKKSFEFIFFVLNTRMRHSIMIFQKYKQISSWNMKQKSACINIKWNSSLASNNQIASSSPIQTQQLKQVKAVEKVEKRKTNEIA